MAFEIKNKIIYIYSAEPWGSMKLSKHHYAIEMANKGNSVYFLESAHKKLRQVIIKKVGENLNIVQYPFIGRGRTMLPKFLYNFLIKLEVKTIIQSIKLYPDIVWSFDAERVNRLLFFKKAIKIFHPVDFFNLDFLPAKKSFDILFSTIEKQVSNFKKKNYKAFFINHGLSEYFVPFAKERIKILKGDRESIIETRVNVGYVGNLIGGSPDRITMRQVIEQNEDIHFHFWGQFEKHNSSLSFHNIPEVFEFIEFLKTHSNVTLHGPIDTFQLAEEIQNMDMFWICWKINDNDIWNRFTNPHKIIEYLSTGKPVITHHIDMYKNSDLVYCLQEVSNDKYPLLFKQVVNSIQNGEDLFKENFRIEYALANTYIKNIGKIEKILQDNFK